MEWRWSEDSCLALTSRRVSVVDEQGRHLWPIAPAGVTHRTIYNHFPTREALCDAFSDYVDGLLVASSGAPEPTGSLASIPLLVEDLYRTLALRDRHARAYVMLMIGNRRPMSAWRKRSLMAEKLIAREQSGRIPLTPRQVTAVIRMFVSTMGWHLLTEQCGLSTDEAAAASAWATRTLLDAAIAKRTTKRTAKPSSSPSQGGANATRRRRN